MPGISRERMAQGGRTPSTTPPDPDRDWTVPTTAADLQARVLPIPDQSRYGHSTDSPRIRGGAR